jgi:hypothetical protein
MFDRDYLGAWDLPHDVTLVIKRVEAGKLKANGGASQKKPILHFNKTDKRFILNKTNGKIIAALYGTDADKWVGKPITLYATKASFGGEQVDAIRVRPTVRTPQKNGKADDVDDAIDDARPVDEAMRGRQEAARAKAETADAGPPPYEQREPGEEG